MDSISSVLRKEIGGKVSISKPKAQLAAIKGKESLGESFEDAKEEFFSTNSVGSKLKDLSPDFLTNEANLLMDVDSKAANRKRKTTDREDNSSIPKHVR